MTLIHRIRAACVSVACAILLAPSVAVAQNFPDRDAREISSYALTEAALAKYKQATSNLNALAKPAACDDDDDDGAAASLDASVAKINAVPGAQAAIQSAGMTTREYVVFTWSMFQTGMGAWALSQPGGTLPPGLSKGNVDFYRAHEQAFDQLGKESSDDCGEGDDSDDYEEEPTE